jgi:hypothetical protein
MGGVMTPGLSGFEVGVGDALELGDTLALGVFVGAIKVEL